MLILGGDAYLATEAKREQLQGHRRSGAIARARGSSKSLCEVRQAGASLAAVRRLALPGSAHRARDHLFLGRVAWPSAGWVPKVYGRPPLRRVTRMGVFNTRSYGIFWGEILGFFWETDRVLGVCVSWRFCTRIGIKVRGCALQSTGLWRRGDGYGW